MHTVTKSPRFVSAARAKTLTRVESRCPHGFLLSVVTCPSGCPRPGESRYQAAARAAVESARGDHVGHFWVRALRLLKLSCPELEPHEREALLKAALGKRYCDV